MEATATTRKSTSYIRELYLTLPSKITFCIDVNSFLRHATTAEFLDRIERFLNLVGGFLLALRESLQRAREEAREGRSTAAGIEDDQQ